MLFKKIPTISTKELEGKLADKPQIIDVREPHEFRGGHIPGAKNVPLNKVEKFIPKETTYVICQSGMRSKKAAKLLLKNEAEVVNVRGGMMSWSGPTRGGEL